MLGQLRKIAKRRKVESGLSGFVPQTDLPFFDYLTGRQLSDTDAKELVLSGGIIHVPQMLQRMDLISDLEHIVGHSWDAFPTIHERLDQDDLVDEICTRRGLTETLVLQAKMLLSCGLKMQDELYLEFEPNVRIHFPYKLIAPRVEEIEARIGSGQASPHGVHKDSWYYHPRRTLNLWCAATDTSSLSGLTILPNSQEHYPDYDDGKILDSEEAIASEHVELDIKAGDAVIFLAELMHGSIINQTDLTRVAISMRMSFEQPSSHVGRRYWYEGVHQRGRKWRLETKFKDKQDFDPKSCSTTMESDNIFGGSNVEIEERSIRVEDESGAVHSFPRYCPHAGADLATGFYCKEDHTLVCPLHRLRVKAGRGRTRVKS